MHMHNTVFESALEEKLKELGMPLGEREYREELTVCENVPDVSVLNGEDFKIFAQTYMSTLFEMAKTGVTHSDTGYMFVPHMARFSDSKDHFHLDYQFRINNPKKVPVTKIDIEDEIIKNPYPCDEHKEYIDFNLSDSDDINFLSNIKSRSFLVIGNSYQNKIRVMSPYDYLYREGFVPYGNHKTFLEIFKCLGIDALIQDSRSELDGKNFDESSIPIILKYVQRARDFISQGFGQSS